MRREPRIRSFAANVFFLALVAVASLPVAAQATPAAGPPSPAPSTVVRAAPAAVCAMLDVPSMRRLMDGLEFNLLWSCGRQNELGQRAAESAPRTARLALRTATVTDVQVNSPFGESGSSATQSETSLAQNETSGTLCSAFNDSWEFYGGGGGLTGFARSTDGGKTWFDGGAVGGISMGDPSVVWRRADGKFYLATLASGGDLAVWVSNDDCQSFSFLSTPATSGDDKELLAVDNSPSSLYYGNLYLVWTDFGVSGTPIRATRSTDGGVTWWSPVTLSSGGSVQGAWPAVAPNGDVFVAWLRYTDVLNGPITIKVSRSVDGGLSYAPVTSPLIDAVSPRDAAATATCGRPALNGSIRYLASPQIAVDASGVLHVVYSYDPDGFNVGDVANVFYRRSTDSGATWGPQIRLNDDVTTHDQYFPTIQTRGSTLIATWYDRRLDSGNLLQDYFERASTDGGVTWGASARVSDVSSPIRIDPNLARCYHGDYDQSVIALDDSAVAQWADDRKLLSGHQDADVWADAARPPLVISDSFSTTGDLNGRVTEVGDVTWSARPGAQTTGGIVVDRSAIGGVSLSPFLGADNPTLEVSARVDLTATTGIGVGFADEAKQAYWTAGQLWVLLRSDGSYVVYEDGTTNSLGAGSIPGTPVNGYHQVQVQYDVAANTGSVSINGVQVLSAVPLSFEPLISFAGFHMVRAHEGGGKVDDFEVRELSPQEQILVSDSFTGSGPLDGRVAEVGGVTWGARAGAQLVGGRVLDSTAIAGVPVDPTALGVYPVLRVSADADPSVSNWLAVGFANQANQPYWIAGQLWALVTETGTFEVHLGSNKVIAGTIPGSPSGGFHHIEVRFDTAFLQAVVLLNGVQVYSQYFGFPLDVSFAGFQMLGAAEGGGKIDNFEVVSTAAP